MSVKVLVLPDLQTSFLHLFISLYTLQHAAKFISQKNTKVKLLFALCLTYPATEAYIHLYIYTQKHTYPQRSRLLLHAMAGSYFARCAANDYCDECLRYS